MCVEIVFFLVTYVCSWLLKFYPNEGEKLLCEGMEITELLRCGGLKPVIVNTGKSPLARATRMLTQDNCLIILWRNQNTGGKY